MPSPGSKGFLQGAVVHQIPGRDLGTTEDGVTAVPSLPAHPTAPAIAAAIVFYGDPQPLLPPPDVAHEPVLGRSAWPLKLVHGATDLELLLLHNAVARSRAPQRRPGVSVR